MALSIDSFLPRFAVGDRNTKTVPIRTGLESLRSKPEDLVARVQGLIGDLKKEAPGIALQRKDLERFRPKDPADLYGKPNEQLMFKSSHNVRHFASVLVLSTFLGNYANMELARRGDPTMDILALQLGAMTHDRFRTTHDVVSTVRHYERHGIQAAKGLEPALRKLGWWDSVSDKDDTLAKTREIDTYHDVDTRAIPQRSTEVGFFNMIDKMELVRLFNVKDLARFPYRVPVIQQMIHFLARARLRKHEGNVGIFGEYRDRFLPIAQALYQESMKTIRGGDWGTVDQFEAVMRAAQTLGIIAPEGMVASPAPQPSLASASLT